MEEGLDTKQILKYYKSSKAKIDSLKNEIERLKAKAARDVEKVQNKLKVTNIYLKKLYDELVKPLFQEVRLKD